MHVEEENRPGSSCCREGGERRERSIEDKIVPVKRTNEEYVTPLKEYTTSNWLLWHATSELLLHRRKEMEHVINAASVVEWLVCCVLVLCCCHVECSPHYAAGLRWGTWDKTLTRHIAMQTDMCSVCNYEAMEVHMSGNHVA